VKDYAGNVTCFRNLKIVIGKTGFCVQDLSRYQKKILMNQKQSAMKKFELLKDIVGWNGFNISKGTPVNSVGNGYYSIQIPSLKSFYLLSEEQLSSDKNFKEIVQRDWEILEFRWGATRYILEDKNGYYWNQVGGYSLKEMLQKSHETLRYSNAKIHSVKRLLDGVIFSVGDGVVYGYNTMHTISEFVIDEEYKGGMKVSLSAKRKSYCHFVTLSTITPLPTTNKEEDSFQWTDELLCEFGNKYGSQLFLSGEVRGKDFIEEFKKSKSQPKEESKKERIEIEVTQASGWSPNLLLKPSSLIPKEKYEAIKEAIERILNDEPLERKPSKFEILKTFQEAFDAARERVGGCISPYKYKNFAEYSFKK
jgi:hypothetical protein